MGRGGYSSDYNEDKDYDEWLEYATGYSNRDDNYTNDYDERYEKDIRNSYYEEEEEYDYYEEEDTFEENIRDSDYQEYLKEENKDKYVYKEAKNYNDKEEKENLQIIKDIIGVKQEKDKAVITNEVTKNYNDSGLIEQISEFLGKTIILTIKPKQLNVFGQVFTPTFIAKLEEVGADYVLIKDVNIKISNTHEDVLPTPLIIPIEQIVWVSTSDFENKFPLY